LARQWQWQSLVNGKGRLVGVVVIIAIAIAIAHKVVIKDNLAASLFLLLLLNC
jgi:hypothetical protein